MQSAGTNLPGHAPLSLRPGWLMLATLVLIYGAGPLAAQEGEPLPTPPAKITPTPTPIQPPAKTVTAQDRTTLAAVVKPEEYAKRAVELAEQRLKRAEDLTTQQNFQAALEELGRYQGLVTHTLDYLKPFGAKGLRKPFRTLEVALRMSIPRIEGIRRQTPMAYGVHVKDIGDYTREARGQALAAFFGDTVLADDQAHPKAKENNEKP